MNGPARQLPARQSRRPDVDKLPPHSDEAELGVIGCCLLSPDDCLTVCENWFKGEQPFFDLKNSMVFNALLLMRRDGKTTLGMPADQLILRQTLKDNGGVSSIGFDYFDKAISMTPSAANLKHYLETLWEKFLARLLMQSNQEIIDEVVRNNGVDEQLLARAKRLQEEFEHATERGDITPRYLKAAGDFGEAFFQRFFGGEHEAPGFELPITFPLKCRYGEATIMSGDDGSGKSTLLNYFAIHLARQMQPGEKIMIASMEMPVDVTLWLLASQLIGSKHQPDNQEGHSRIIAALDWLNAHFIFYDFTGIADWRDLLDTFRYAVEHSGMKIGIIDSVMRIGIPDDDYAQQGLAAAHFGQFTIEHNCHLFYVIHENKGDGSGKNKIRGSKLWTANANNVLSVKINSTKGEKMDKLKWDLDRLQALPPDSGRASEIREIEEEIDRMKRDWDTELNLRKQRYPGTRQNGSKKFWFDPSNFQFRNHWEDPPVNWLDRWKRSAKRAIAEEATS